MNLTFHLHNNKLNPYQYMDYIVTIFVQVFIHITIYVSRQKSYVINKQVGSRLIGKLQDDMQVKDVKSRNIITFKEVGLSR